MGYSLSEIIPVREDITGSNRWKDLWTAFDIAE